MKKSVFRNKVICLIMTVVLMLPSLSMGAFAAIPRDECMDDYLYYLPSYVVKGSTAQMSYEGMEEMDAYEWVSSDTSVATVSSSGVVTGVSCGKATITCYYDWDGDYYYNKRTVYIVSGKSGNSYFCNITKTGVSGDFIYYWYNLSPNVQTGIFVPHNEADVTDLTYNGHAHTGKLTSFQVTYMAQNPYDEDCDYSEEMGVGYVCDKYVAIATASGSQICK